MAVVDSFFTSTAGLFKTIEILKTLVYVSAGVFVAESVSSAPFDWSLLSGSRQRRWAHLLYFGAKLSYLAFLIQIITVFWLQSEIDCQAYLYAWEFLMGLTVILSSALLACRTIAIYARNSRTSRYAATGAVLLFGLALVTAWMQGVTDVTAAWLPAAASPWNDGACLWTAVKKTYYVKYVVTIVFDLLVLFLTVAGIVTMNARSRIGGVLVQQGLFYFIITFLVNLVITILTALQLSPTMSLIAALPQSTICVIAATRLYSQLVSEAAKPYPSQPSSAPNSSMSNTIKSTSTIQRKSLSPSSASFFTKQVPTDLEKGRRLDEQMSMEEDIITSQLSEVVTGAVVDPTHPFSNLTVLSYGDISRSGSGSNKYKT